MDMKLAPVIFAFCTLFASASFAQPTHVTRIHIKKSTHTLELFDGAAMVKSYKVAIGPGGSGPKLREGDKVTPTGRYWVGAGRPSQFHVFMDVSYPNDADKKRFDTLKSEGKLPKDATIGGAIGIHGVGSKTLSGVHKASDWTWGCIALDDDEIDEISHLVKAGTPVDIDD
jgi:murein L,D-transpeptidase YafK